MADEHRRVEARPTISGTGMASDPERIETLEHDYQRRVRASQPKHGPDFGEVLAHAPAANPEDELEPEVEADAEEDEEANAEPSSSRSSAESSSSRSTGAESSSSRSTGAGDAPEDKLADNDAEAALPRVAPDPRMAALHQRFAKPAAVPAPVPTMKTPQKQKPSETTRAPRRSRSSSERKS